MIYGKEEVFISPNKHNAIGINFICLCGKDKFNNIYIVKKIKKVE